MEKNKLILNEYLGIFMHFESIFFNLENGVFQTYPPTKSGKFQIFLETFPDDHIKKKKNCLEHFSTFINIQIPLGIQNNPSLGSQYKYQVKIIPPYCSTIRKKRKKETF